MMTICDIYDALSASDRLTTCDSHDPRSLDILKLLCSDEEIDPELFRVFLDAQVYRLAGKSAANLLSTLLVGSVSAPEQRQRRNSLN